MRGGHTPPFLNLTKKRAKIESRDSRQYTGKTSYYKDTAYTLTHYTTMKAKITALVSGILALSLDILMIAADFAAAPILIFILILVAIAALVAAIVDEKRNVVTLVETRANGKRPVDNALKLANEVAPYIKVSDGRIYLKVVKQK